MADNDITATSPPPASLNLGKAILDPINHGLAASTREALRVGVPGAAVIEMLLNHLCSVVAMVEPAGAREETIRGVVGGFAGLCHQHVEARKTTPGGIRLP